MSTSFVRIGLLVLCCLVIVLTAPVLFIESDPSVDAVPHGVLWVALIGAIVGVVLLGRGWSKR